MYYKHLYEKVIGNIEHRRLRMRSPNWKEEELKIALELYLSKDLEWLAKMKDSTPEVILLSQLLNGLDFFGEPKPENFRSCGSIRMKLSNFKALDIRYGKASLSNIGSMDKEIWNQYHDNLPLLREECQKIAIHHFRGKRTHELDKYISEFGMRKDISNISTGFMLFANDTYVLAEQYRKKALQEPNLEWSQRMIDTCYQIMKALEWCKSQNLVNNDSEKKVYEYQEHGGINQVPINENEEKVGRYIQTTFERLVKQGFITDKVVNDLLDGEWSRQHLHIGHPFIKEIDPEKNLSSQLHDHNGYLRYWKHVYVIDGKKYCVCKEWYESGRKYFDEWVASVIEKQSFGLSKADLISILTFIKDADQKSVSIKKEEILKKLNVTDKETIFGKFLDMGLIAPFQGTENELVVDDYDLLFEMMENSEKYI